MMERGRGILLVAGIGGLAIWLRQRSISPPPPVPPPPPPPPPPPVDNDNATMIETLHFAFGEDIPADILAAARDLDHRLHPDWATANGIATSHVFCFTDASITQGCLSGACPIAGRRLTFQFQNATYYYNVSSDGQHVYYNPSNTLSWRAC